ncbi:MAG: universal stress protein [Chloroflexota bacterium]
MYRKILVPLDGSEFAECVLPHAKAVATGCQVPEVVLLYVVEPVRQPARAYMDSSVLEQARRDSMTSAKEYLNKVSSDLNLPGSTVQTVVVEGYPGEQILDYAEKNQVDLITMSTHGRSGVARWAVGSIADRVLRHSVAPVLVSSPAACRIG